MGQAMCGCAFSVEKHSRSGYWSNWEFHHWHDYTRPYSEKILNCMASIGYTMKNCGECGYPIEQDTIELHPLLNKNVSELCGHARRQRFEKQDRKEFENYVADVFPMRKVQRKLRNTRNLVLFLVENCTAWLYLTKPIGNSLKVAISDLFFLLLDIQRRIPEDSNDFLERMHHMEVKARDLIALIQRYKLNWRNF
ncbi:unnamed protein product [Cylicocyclus nassatus]|uniref:Uncharacterized protein n=1 Tax=Cylicocyclus nassatus TaxID=53992 RepID=A0AA36H4M6_CYLNA|nr:unnamed protein product [Cylicocyclus nassatus]